MGAALSIAVLFTVSSTIVRIAGVFLEHTGIPRNIARLQAMSALSGTGFTTVESELLLQTPERRRILVLLIITGSIGLASVVATLVVGAFGIHGTLLGFAGQVLAILLSLVYLRYILFSQTVDDLVCGAANRWLAKRASGRPSYDILSQIDGGTIIASHHLAGNVPADPKYWALNGLIPIGTRSDTSQHALHLWDSIQVDTAEILVLAGPQTAHDAFGATYGKPTSTAGH